MTVRNSLVARGALIAVLPLALAGASSREQPVLAVERPSTPVLGVPVRAVITNITAWSRLWSFQSEALNGGPAIDLSQRVAIVVAAGRMAGGSTMTVADPVVRSGVVVVRVQQTMPGEGCPALSAIAAPTVVMVVPVSSLPTGELRVRFDESAEVRRCD